MTKAAGIDGPSEPRSGGHPAPLQASLASTTADLVRFEDVAFAYETGVQAISALTLNIPRGSSVGIIGPSGCGKSTLLFLLAGLYRAQRGRIVWPDGGPQEGHRLTMVFQRDTLLPWLTVRGNIELYYKFNKSADKADLAARVAELVRMAALDGFENAYPYQLSGGMKRRAAFLSAVIPLPETLLLDEPFSSLDEPTRVAIHQDVFSIVRRLGSTVVLVTHDLAEAISLCDEVIILTNRPGSVYSRHSVPFGSDRNMLELRREREFLDLYGILWEELSQQITRARDVRTADEGDE